MWTRLPGSIASSTNACRLSAEASATRRMRIRPDPAAPVLLDRHGDQHLVSWLPPPQPGFLGPPVRLVHLDAPAKPVPAGADHGPSQLVQPRPGRLVAAQPQHLLQAPGHSRRSSGVVTHHIARNHIVNGVRVSWKIVPAVTEVCRPQAAHSHRTRRTGQALSWPQRRTAKAVRPSQLHQDRPGTPPPSRSAPRTRPASGDSPPRAGTLYLGAT